MIFLNKFKKDNQETFKHNSKLNKINLTESYYNMFELGNQSTKNYSSNKSDKISSAATALKDNSKKALSDNGDHKIKRNIKFNYHKYRRSHENKFIDLYSSKINALYNKFNRKFFYMLKFILIR